MNTPNKSVETNRRPAFPLDAEREFGRPAHASAALSAAVAHLWRSVKTIQHLVGMLALVALLGCASGDKFDARLNGTWKSNREESVADAFRRDPRWTNAAPEKVERFRDMFGHMTLTYSNGVVTTRFKGEAGTLRYTVLDRGEDYVVIRVHGGIQDGKEIRIRFVDNDKAYWITTQAIMGDGLRERFDKVITEQDGAANGSQPIRSETNRTSSAAGSRR